MVEFPQFGKTELYRFLAAVDRHLHADAEIVVIGGSAMLLEYGVDAVTNDVDTFESNQAIVEEAAKKARIETGLHIPLADVPIADLPWHFNSRLVRILPELARLAIFVPERHDLTLSKLVRGFANDFQAVEELHHNQPLDLDILVERYRAEMGHSIHDPARLRLTFSLWVEWLFGETAAARVNAELGSSDA